jgi:hypothetical protein
MYCRSQQWSDGNTDTDSIAAAAGDFNNSSQHSDHTTDDDATAAILASLQRQRSNQSLTSNTSQQQQQQPIAVSTTSSTHDTDVYSKLSESARNLHDQIPDLTYMLQTQIQVPVKGVMTGSGMRTRVLSDAFNFDDS